jgi:translation initiation factor IF-2
MKKLINKIKTTLSRVFGDILGFLVTRGQVAVNATNIIKKLVENPALSFVVELTPTKKDDALLAKAKELIPGISIKVALAMAIIKEAEANEDRTIAMGIILDRVSNHLPNEGKAIFYREISGALAEYLSDGELTTAEAVAIAQLVFKNRL